MREGLYILMSTLIELNMGEVNRINHFNPNRPSLGLLRSVCELCRFMLRRLLVSQCGRMRPRQKTQMLYMVVVSCGARRPRNRQKDEHADRYTEWWWRYEVYMSTKGCWRWSRSWVTPALWHSLTHSPRGCSSKTSCPMLWKGDRFRQARMSCWNVRRLEDLHPQSTGNAQESLWIRYTALIHTCEFTIFTKLSWEASYTRCSAFVYPAFRLSVCLSVCLSMK